MSTENDGPPDGDAAAPLISRQADSEPVEGDFGAARFADLVRQFLNPRSEDAAASDGQSEINREG